MHLWLIRHAESEANAQGLLAGQKPYPLSATGRQQAQALAGKLADVSFATIVVSPMLRTRQTAEHAFSAEQMQQHTIRDAIAECDYGAWTDRAISDLETEPLWGQIQTHPSSITFPEGESMLAMAQRSVACVRHLAAQHADDAHVAIVTHADIVKAVLADALGMHFDQFQRLMIDPASISRLTYRSTASPVVSKINDTVPIASSRPATR